MKFKKDYEAPIIDFRHLFGLNDVIVMSNPIDSGNGLDLSGYDFNDRWW